MRRQLVPALGMVACSTLLCGLAYPLVVTGLAQVAFARTADGSLVERDGRVVGSSLLAQRFTEDRYFWPRPSAAGDGYDPAASGASNLGPGNDELRDAVATRVEAYRRANDLDPGRTVPVDAVTASGSGLDPHISPANARIQARRVSGARGIDLAEVLRIVDEHTDGRDLGVLGEPGVNVLAVNLALDELS